MRLSIVIDPGHGGRDTGALNPRGGMNEEDYNLAIAIATTHRLQDYYGHTVFLTRDKDMNLSLSERVAMIHKHKPHCFVSIHCNSSVNRQANGMEVIWRDEYDYPLAQSVYRFMEGLDVFRERGIKQDVRDLGRHLAVLSDLRTPACLVEVGFISSDKDIQQIEDTDFVARGISDGIHSWAVDTFGIPAEITETEG